MQLFTIFEYLSRIHNPVFGDYNGGYYRRKRDKLSPFRMTSRWKQRKIVVWELQKLFVSIQNFK